MSGVLVKKKFLAGPVAIVAALSLAACGAAPEEEETTAGGGEQTSAEGGESTGGDVETVEGFKPCVVSDEGGFDDRSFNELSYNGVVQAAEELGVDFGEVQSDTATDYAPNIDSLIGEGCTAIVSVGYAIAPDTVAAATANPDLQFILVDDAADTDFDGTKDAENIKPLVYDTAEAAFLAGYLSAGYSEAGKVGTFGGQEFPTVTIFMDGFYQGVQHYNEQNGTDVQVVGWDGTTGLFTGGFAANDTAKQTAADVIDQGVDVLLPVGGPIYQSAMDAIKDSGREIALIGVDADFYETDEATQDIVLTSILKQMDVSVYESLMALAQGDTDMEAYIGTLENGGVGLAPLHNYEDKVDPELWTEVEELQQQIIAGEVEVTSYLNQ